MRLYISGRKRMSRQRDQLLGLTVADRLTEDPSTTVLVLEYGPFDAQEPSVLVPGLLNLTSTPHPYLDSRTFQVTTAAAVGGGIVINGMLFHRGAKADYEAWEELGAHGWGWSDLLPYFKMTEMFKPPFLYPFRLKHDVHRVRKAIIITGMPIPSPTPIAILSDRFSPSSGSSSPSSDAAVVCPILLVSDPPVGCRVLVPVALLLTLGCEAVGFWNVQVKSEVQYAPVAQQFAPQQVATEKHARLEPRQQVNF
jgi:hypothetical protein